MQENTRRKITFGMTLMLGLVLLVMLVLMGCGAPSDYECEEGDDIVSAEGECDD